MKNTALLILDYDDGSDLINKIMESMPVKNNGAKVWFMSVHKPWIEAVHKASELDDEVFYNLLEEAGE